MTQFTVAVAQLDSRADKAQNVQRMRSFVDEAANRDANLVAFPEMATYMGDPSRYTAVAESFPGPTTKALAEKAQEHGLYVHTGSFFESIPESNRVYNTSGVIDPDGTLLDTYRKIHLFDIHGDVEYQESDNVAPGEEVTTVDTELGTVGLSICYDLRFPQLYRALAARSAEVLFVPAAFSLHTGKDHWESLLRARAIENQAYVVAPGQIGDKPDSMETYGKSLVVDPWGTVIAKASDRPEMITATVDLDYLDEVRTKLQTLEHVRPDVYE
jgi:predicted amidohydrolase